ncbi:MAG: DUF4130 domain-containing protein [Flavobacteriaceae bacterium]|nr:DUF4130 domain-containing protein [Muriicola sp.]NNL40220.1 DUF4130 domain-containing protein [Flavobacteriaceae bacterium]
MKQKTGTYYYDGSFNGFLTLLHEVRYKGVHPKAIVKLKDKQAALFPQPNYVATRLEDAKQIWNGLRSQNYSALKTLYFAFLSEEENIEIQLYYFYISWQKQRIDEQIPDKATGSARIYQLANLVEKEKRAVERFLVAGDFPETSYVKFIKPKYNILPLISRYFRTRYRNDDWLICDINRNYGLQHQSGSLAFVAIKPEQLRNNTEDKMLISSPAYKKKRRKRSLEVLA